MPVENGIQSQFEAQLIELCSKYRRQENQLADDLGISFGWFSKVKNGATPSRALVSNVARLHKEYFSSPVQETVKDGPQDYKPGESTVDLPAETMELAQTQVAAGRFRDVREYLVHLVSRDTRDTRTDAGALLQSIKDRRLPKKRNQNPKSAGKHGSN